MARQLQQRGSEKRSQTLHRSARYACEMLEVRLMLSSSWSTITVPSSVTTTGVSNMMMLSDGTLMVHGNDNGEVSNQWYSLMPAQPGTTPGLDKSYINGTWTTLNPMSVQRNYFPSVVLPNGNVFVLGGEFASDQNLSITAEIYNTATKSWIPGIRPFAQNSIGVNLAPTAGINSPPQNYDGKVCFGDDPLEVLPDGRVLAGSIFDDQTFIYDPVTNAWSSGATKYYTNDRSDEETWVKLPDGSILTYDLYASAIQNTFLAERYVPTINGVGQWFPAIGFNPLDPPTQLGNRTTILNGTSAELGGAVLMPNGNVFITGNTNATGNTALYDTASGRWSAGPTVTTAAGSFVAGGDLPMAMMPNGHVLLGEWDSTFPAAGCLRILDYNPNAASAPYFTDVTPATFHNANYPYMLVLPTGQILMSDESTTLYVYTSDVNFNSAWQPQINSITNGSGGNVFTLTGIRLNGISEGAAYGDDAEMSSNYPIVQLTDQFGTVSYARSFNWSSVGVSGVGGTALETVYFTLPSTDVVGAYRVSVIANGIPSPVMLDIQMGAATTTNLTIQADPVQPTSVVDIVCNGTVGATFYLSTFYSLMVSGDYLSDTILINDAFLTGPVVVDGGDANDFIRMEAAGGGATFYGGNGNDDFDLSYYAHNLSNIPGFTDVFGGQGADSIFLYDNALSYSAVYTINAPLLIRAGFGGLDFESDIEGVTLTTGANADNVSVIATASGTPVYLNSAGGADIVNIGGSDGLNSIAADVQVQNTPNFSTLNINDTGDLSARNMTVDTSSGFGYVASLSPYAASIYWKVGDVSAVNITSGSNDDTINIHTTSIPLTYNSSGDLHGDSVILGNTTNGMQGISANVTLLNSPDVSDITLDDQHDSSARTITQSTVTISGSGYGQIAGLAASGALIDYRYLDTNSLTVDTSSSGGNVINILASSRTLNFVGASPLLGAHDTVNIGNSALLTGILGPLNFSNRTGFDDISVSDSADSSAAIFNLSTFFPTVNDAWGTIIFANSGAPSINYRYSDTASVSLVTGTGATANVYDTGTATTVSQIAFGHFTANVFGTTSPLTIFHYGSGAAGLVVNLGNAGNAQAIQGAVTIQDPSIDHSAVTIDNSADMSACTGTITATTEIGITPALITYPTNNTFIVYAGNGGSTATVSSNPSIFQLVGGNGNDIFNISGTTAGTQPFVYTYGGNDTINIGGGALPQIGALLTVDAGTGADTVTFNNQSETVGLGFTIAPTSVTAQFFFAGVNYTNAENLIFNTGAHNDSVNITGTNSGTAITVNGNIGGDAYSIGNPSTTQSIASLVTINGGGGTNNLVIDDHLDATTRTFNLVGNVVGGTAGDTLFGSGGSVAYSGISSLTINAGTGGNTINVNTPAVTSPLTLNSGTGNDHVNVLANGGTLAVNGQGGSDAVTIGNAGITQAILADVTVGNVGGSSSLLVNDSTDTTGRVVTIDASSVSGMAFGVVHYTESSGSVVSPLTVKTGAGADTVSLLNTNSTAGLVLSTGGGNDTVSLTPVTNQITGIAGSVSFDGGTGTDVLNLDDSSALQRSIWTVTTNQVQDLFLPSFITITIPYSTFESLVINGGAFANLYNVVSTTALTPVTLNEGSGNDANNIGDSSAQTVQGVNSAVTVNAGGGTNTLALDDTSINVAVKVHVTATQVGAALGDTLFSAGGSVTYSGISTLTLTTTKATIGDTIDLTPSASTAFTINGGNPTTSPGDTLTIATLGVTNPVLIPNGTGAGQYTFGNRQSVTFTGIEQVIFDNVPPTVTNAVFNFNTSQSLTITFSEDVSASLSGAPVTLLNQTTGGLPGYTVGTYDHVANAVTLSFPALLPDGNYHTTLAAGTITDAAGNALAADFTYDFFVLAGDANHDRHVNATDQAILTAHLGQSGNFSNGDFSYNGTVDAADTTILNSNLNLWLPPQGTLDFPSTTADDNYTLKVEATVPTLLDLNYASSAAPSQSYRIPQGAVSFLTFSGGSGNDSLTVDFTNGSPLPGTGFLYDGGAGQNTLALIGQSGNHSVVFEPYVPSYYFALFDQNTVEYTNVQTSTFDPAGGADQLTVMSTSISLPVPSTAASISTLIFSALAIQSGGTIKVPNLYKADNTIDRTHHTLLDVSNLTLINALNAISGTLDLGANDMIVRNAGTIGLTNINTLLKAGFNAGAGYWNGTGGIISTSAAADTRFLTTLGYRAGGIAFDGVNTSSSDVLVKYTYFGDADLNGTVNGADYQQIDSGFGAHATGWSSGDFNYDGVVDGSDYSLIDNAFNQITATGAAPLELIARPAVSFSTHAISNPKSTANFVFTSTQQMGSITLQPTTFVQNALNGSDSNDWRRRSRRTAETTGQTNVWDMVFSG